MLVPATQTTHLVHLFSVKESDDINCIHAWIYYVPAWFGWDDSEDAPGMLEPVTVFNDAEYQCMIIGNCVYNAEGCLLKRLDSLESCMEYISQIVKDIAPKLIGEKENVFKCDVAGIEVFI